MREFVEPLPPVELEKRTGQGPFLTVERLSVYYGAGPTKFLAVDDVSFDIDAGDRVALVGESGSGKTTLGLAIAGFLSRPGARVDAQRLEFRGATIRNDTRLRLPHRTPGIAMVFQDAMTSLDPVWTIGSQLRAVIRANDRLSRAEVRDRSRYWLDRVGIRGVDRVLKNRPYELSGGMRQRAMIALALCSRPKLLIADEPTSALDASLARKTMDLLLELTLDSGAALLMISHDIALCQDYTQTTMVMYRGQIVEVGTPAGLSERATHPYTMGLLQCIPTLESADLEELPTLESFSVSGALADGDTR